MKDPLSTFTPVRHVHHFTDLGVEVHISHLHEKSHDLWGEVVVYDLLSGSGFLHRKKWNLNANTTLSRVAKDLQTRYPLKHDWEAVFEAAFWRTVDAYRAGAEMQLLDGGEDEPPPGYLIDPYVSDTGVSILFGQGGSGKSIVALGLALALATGQNVLGKLTDQRPHRVLYLDWEAEKRDHKHRLNMITRGHNLPRPVETLWYRREWASLPTIADSIRSIISQFSIEVVVVDSLGGARGGAPESAEETIAVFSAIRSWGVPALAIDHQSKANLANPKQTAAPFGSVYTQNMARLMWAIQTAKEDGSNTFGSVMTNTKANNDRQHYRHAIQYTVDRDNETTVFERTDLLGLPMDVLSQSEQLLQALKGSTGATVKQLADSTGLTPPSVRSVLNRRTDLFVNIGGSGREGRWVRRVSDDELI